MRHDACPYGRFANCMDSRGRLSLRGVVHAGRAVRRLRHDVSPYRWTDCISITHYIKNSTKTKQTLRKAIADPACGGFGSARGKSAAPFPKLRLRSISPLCGEILAPLRMTLGAQKRRKMYYVYILTNTTNATMYVGVTDDLHRRLREHKSERIDGFTKDYHVHKLVYYEEYSEINIAIAREKQLKRWVRSKKNWLVETKNPNWDDWGERFY